MRNNSGPCNCQSGDAGGQEVEWAERDPVSVALQPMVQIIVGHWPRDYIGNQHRNGELPQQEPHDIARASSEHFAEANLLGATLDGEGGNAEETETSDQDGDT